MVLYLYKIGETIPVLTIENAESYTENSIIARNEDGNTVNYAPLSEDCELSSKEDCSEALREAWRTMHPNQQTRMEELEELMAQLLFGGEKE